MTRHRNVKGEVAKGARGTTMHKQGWKPPPGRPKGSKSRHGTGLQTDPGLVELALNLAALFGNRSKAIRVMEEQYGHKVTGPTLTNWIENDHEHFLELCEQYEGRTKKIMAAEAVEVATRAAETAGDFVVAAAAALKENRIEGRDLATSARNIAQVHDTMTKSSFMLRGEATDIGKIENLDELVGALEGLGVMSRGREDIRDAETVEEEPSDDSPSLPAG